MESLPTQPIGPRGLRADLYGYAGAVVSVAVATGLRFLLDPWLGDQASFPTYIAAVTVIALYAGWGPSWLALGLGLLCADYWFLSPRGTFALSGPSNQIGIGLYVLVSGLIAVLGRARNESQEQLRRLVGSLRESSWKLDNDLQFFKRLIDQTRDAVYVVDPKAGFRFAHANEACCALLGHPLDAVLRMAIPDFAPDFPLERCEEFWQTVKTRRALTFEARFRRGDGKIVSVEVTASDLEFQGKEYVVGTARDITERERLMESIEQKEKWYRALLESAPDMIAVLDPDGSIRYHSPSVSRVTGYPPSDLLGKPVWNFVHPDDLPTVTDVLTRLVHTPGLRLSIECRLRKADGQWLTIDASGQSTEGAGGGTMVIVNSRDITEGKQMRDALQANVERSLRQSFALLSLTQEQSQELAPSRILRGITEATARTLGVGRVSIWLFNQDRSAIRCEDLYDGERKEHSSGMELRAADYPAYFQALTHSDIIDANDARHDPRTWEFTSHYLIPLEIGAMMDAGLWINGKLCGVICQEHVGGPRTWMVDEKIFVVAVSNIVSLALVQTQRRQAQEEAQRMRERLELALKAGNTGLWAWNVKTNEIYLSPSWKAQLGYADDEIPNRFEEFESRIHRDDLKQVHDQIATFLMNPVSEFISEFRLRHKDGTYRWSHTQARLYPNADGQMTRFTGCNVDITERKKMEDAIRVAEQLYRMLLSSTLEGIYGIDAEQRCTFINKAGAALIGYTQEECLGKNMHALIHHTRRDGSPFPEEDCPIFNVTRTARGCRLEDEVLWRCDGTKFLASYSAFPIIEDETTRGAVIIFTDITERRQLEAQSRQLERLAALSQLLGGIAHELKNPLFIMAGSLQIAREKLQKKEYAGLPASCEKMQETIKRLTAIVERFLHLASPVSAGQARCAVPALLQEVLDLMRGELTQKRINVKVFYAPDLPETWVDLGQLREVFLRLITNAVQATAEAHGKGTLTVKAELSAVSDQPSASEEKPSAIGHQLSAFGGRQEENWIEVRIQDNGPGIPSALRTKLFEPFVTTKPPDKGTGLGLWIVRSNLMMLHGTVRVESEEGHGATFIVRLPVVPEPSLPADPPLAGTSQASDQDRKNHP